MTGERSHTLILPAEAGIKTAQELAESLRDALAEHDHVAIDTGAVTGADITTVQSLLAARASAAAAGKSVTLLSPLAPPLRQVLAAAGFLAPGQEHAGFWPETSNPSEDAAA